MKIVIVGGGFAGVKTALELSSHKDIDITLVTDKPDFQYYPALYSTATGHSHLESWVPLQTIFHGRSRVKVVIDSVKTIDPAKKIVSGASGADYQYDRAILALGTVTTYFGIKGLDTYSQGIKSADEINRLKAHLHDEFTNRHTPDGRYVIVGAGPTGVELAAAIGSYLRRLCKRYGMIDHPIAIDLVEAAPRILPKMSEKSSELVTRRLRKLGVTIHTGKAVQSENAHELMVGDEPIQTRTVIWTSGVANHPFYKENSKHFMFAPNGRVCVDKFMIAAPDVYVLGDNAATPFTGLAQTALHDAIFTARNIKRELAGKPKKEYTAVMPPVVVPVGRHWAVFEWHGVRLYGLIGAALRRIADFLGYSDILPIGQALGVWRASRAIDDSLPTSD